MKKINTVLTLTVIIFSSLLSGCEPYVFGIPQSQFNALTPAQQTEVIKGYNQNRALQTQYEATRPNYINNSSSSSVTITPTTNIDKTTENNGEQKPAKPDKNPQPKPAPKPSSPKPTTPTNLNQWLKNHGAPTSKPNLAIPPSAPKPTPPTAPTPVELDAETPASDTSTSE